MPLKIYNILELPEEVIREILLYVPNRFNVATSCNLFYELVCNIERDLYKLKIDYFSVCKRSVH